MDNVVGLDWDGISLETARKRQNKIEKKEQTSTLLYKTKNGFHLEIIFKVPLLVSENFKLREKYYDCSVSEDTTLYWKENGKLQFSKISQVYSSFKKGNKVNVIGIHLKKKDERLTKKNCEITWMPIKYVACHGKQKIYQITLNNGQKVEITHHHSLFGKYDGRQEITSLNLHEINPNIFKIAHITKEIKEKNNARMMYKLLLSKFRYTSYCNNTQLDFFKYIKQTHHGKKISSKKIYSGYRTIKGNVPTRSTLLHYLKDFEELGLITHQDTYKNKHEWIIEQNAIIYRKKINELKKYLPNFLIVCGLWLADGCYDTTNIKLFIGYDVKIRRWLTNWCKINNYKHKVVDNSTGDMVFVIFSTKLVKHMKQLGFNGKAGTKKIPEDIYTLSNKNISNLLKGYFSGDGYQTISKKYLIIAVSSISKNLIDGVSILLSKLGIRSHICYVKNKNFNKKTNSNKKIYRLQVSKDYAKFTDKIPLLKTTKEKKKFIKRTITHKDKNLSFRKIRDITFIGTRTVYDIEVGTPHSFVTASGILCHNSERLMYSKLRYETSGEGFDILFNMKKGVWRKMI